MNTFKLFMFFSFLYFYCIGCNGNSALLMMLNAKLSSLVKVHATINGRIPALSLRSDFFKGMVGVYEQKIIHWYQINKYEYNQIFLQNKLIRKAQIKGKDQFIIRSYDGKKEYQAGYFSDPTISTLRDQANKKLSKIGGGTFNIVLGVDTDSKSSHRETVDIGAMQADPKNKDAVFQVASNFSALEPTGIGHYPEPGITGYINDYTQGPFASISAAPGLFYRMYGIFYNPAKEPVEWRQTKKNQVELLRGGLDYPNLKEIFPVTNGYVNYRDYPDTLNNILNKKAYGDIRIGYHRDIQVLYGFVQGDKHYDVHDPQQVINQVFTAAIDFGYLNSEYKNDDRVIRRAKALLKAAYEGTLLAAATNQKKKVFLTLIGGGVFGNNVSWIAEAIFSCEKIIKDYGLEVTLVVYSYNSLMTQNTKKDLEVFKNLIAKLVSTTNGIIMIDGSKSIVQSFREL